MLVESCCLAQGAQLSALWWPRGVGRRIRGRSEREAVRVQAADSLLYSRNWQHCTAVILQIKTKRLCTHHFLRNVFMDVKDIVFALKEFTVWGWAGGENVCWENKEFYLFYFYFLYLYRYIYLYYHVHSMLYAMCSDKRWAQVLATGGGKEGEPGGKWFLIRNWPHEARGRTRRAPEAVGTACARPGDRRNGIVFRIQWIHTPRIEVLKEVSSEKRDPNADLWTLWVLIVLNSLDCKEIKPVNPKRNQPWIFIRRTDAEAETPIR